MAMRRGQPAKLNDSRRLSIARMIGSGPNPMIHGAVSWRLAAGVELWPKHGYRYCGALTKYRNTRLEIINFRTIGRNIVLVCVAHRRLIIKKVKLRGITSCWEAVRTE